MGKKGRRARHKNPLLMKMNQNFLQQGVNEAFAKMGQMDLLTFDEQKATIRRALLDMGTDCALNDSDPMGNGDQSMIQTNAKRDAARELFAIGGDMEGHFSNGKLSPFMFSCVTGQVENVRMTLEDETARLEQPWSQQVSLKKLLDTRETSLRMSPLLLMVSLGRRIITRGGDEITSPLLATAKLLLEYGATPNVQDVLGKTVVHYGAGAMADNMSMELSDMCIEASKSINLYAKEVELKDLDDSNDNPAIVNGMRGIVGGYKSDSGERSVYLTEQKRQIWINPKYLILVENDASTNEKGVKLVNVQDRNGAISLLEVIMQDRVDVATFLLKKHGTSIHISDMEGMSALKMSIGPGGMMSSVCRMVNEANQREAADRLKIEKGDRLICDFCKKKLSSNSKPFQCKKCKSTTYCGPDCQANHWKNGHRKECSNLSKASQGVKLEPPPNTGMHSATFSFTHGATGSGGSYRLPDGTKSGELFLVKVQANNAQFPIMIYDETRTCQFTLHPGQPGFQEVLTETQKEMTWDGRKTFMKASFDESGQCTIFPNTAQVKAKYKW